MGNIAVHLPDADVLIQVSNQQGLRRQEEVQRSGREDCPGKMGARMRFYTLVSLRTCEEDFAQCVAWMKRSEIQETPGFRPDGLHPGYGVFVQPLTPWSVCVPARRISPGIGNCF